MPNRSLDAAEQLLLRWIADDEDRNLSGTMYEAVASRLKDHGLVTIERAGGRYHCRITKTGREALDRTARRSRGRPSKSFLEDPERYSIALSDALIALGVPEPSAFTLAATLLVGRVESLEVESSGRQGHVVLVRDDSSPEKPTTSLLGKADTLRGKSKHRPRKGVAAPLSDEEAMWRTAMAVCFQLALNPKDRLASEVVIRCSAATVGEAEYAERTILPMLSQKFWPPDFSPPD